MLQQPVEPIPPPVLVQWEDHDVVTVQSLEHVVRSRPIEHLVAELTREPEEAGHLAEECPIVGIELGEPLVAEVVDEADVVGDVRGHRGRAEHLAGEPHSGWPPLEDIHHVDDVRIAGIDAQCLEQAVCLGPVERQIVDGHVDDPGRETESAQRAVIVVAAADQDDGGVGSEVLHHRSDQPVAVGAVDPMDVVEHQHERLGAWRRRDPVLECTDVRVDGGGVRRRRHRDVVDAGQRLTERCEQADRVVVGAAEVDPADVSWICRDPTLHEVRLAESRRGEDPQETSGGAFVGVIESAALDHGLLDLVTLTWAAAIVELVGLLQVCSHWPCGNGSRCGLMQPRGDRR